MSWGAWFVTRFRWIEWAALALNLRNRRWNRIDATWLLLRVGCEPVNAAQAEAASAVLVLGGSVSGGGGVGNRPELAWHAALGDGVRPTVHYKHAVDPSYFLHCASRFVDRAYDVVLLDLGANLFDTPAQEALVGLIRRMRCLTNASAVAVVDWPGVVRSNASRVATAQTRAALLDVPHGPELHSTDRVHPNARGHAVIAERVRAYLDSLRGVAKPVAPRSCATAGAEVCFPSALDMPVVRDVTGEPRGWRFVDESPTPQLLHKYGWTSSTPGATLTLVVPLGEACGAVVTLAYLASNFTGPFRLACAPGCACSPVRTYFQRRIHPFPIVTGREDCAVPEQGDCTQIKVTRDTTFNLLREGDAPCRVTVTALAPQQVRLDGLYVREPGEHFAWYALHSAVSNRAQRWFGQNAHRHDCSRLAAFANAANAPKP